jgi:hypothetical protein
VTPSIAVLHPASVLSADLVAAARAVAAGAPPFTPAQRDLLRGIFQPSVRKLHATRQANG